MINDLLNLLLISGDRTFQTSIKEKGRLKIGNITLNDLSAHCSTYYCIVRSTSRGGGRAFE